MAEEILDGFEYAEITDNWTITSANNIWVEDGSFIGPLAGGASEGTRYAYIQNYNGQSPSTVGTFIDESAAALNALGNGNCDEGAAMKRTFSISGAGTIRIRWRFLTDEDVPAPFNNDFAFVKITGGTINPSALLTLVNTEASPFGASPTLAVWEYPDGVWTTFSAACDSAGTYTVYIGVINVFDFTVRSILLVDNITFEPEAAPEPAPVESCNTEDWDVFEPIVDVRAYDSSGLRIAFPQPHEVSFDLSERGGYGAGSLKLLEPWDGTALTGRERIDVYLFNELSYRGRLRVHQRELDNPEQFSPSLFGLVELLRIWIVRRRYVYGYPTDISQVFSDIIDDYVAVSGRLPNVVTDAQTVGLTIQVFDAVNLSVAEAFGMLCDLSPNSAIWGADVNASLSDRLYIRSRSNAVVKKYAVGGPIRALVHPYDTGSVRNVMYLRGATVSQPNLVTNGSFEKPLPNSETVGNLMTDYSFEEDDPAWTLTGSRKQQGGDATAVGSPRTGSWWLEIDQNNEKGEQVITGIDFSVPYIASCWIRYEHATNSVGRTFTFEVEGLDASDVLITTAEIVGPVDPGGTTWRKYSGTVDFTSYSNVVKARFRVRAHAGIANNDGILVEDCAFYERDGVSASGWRHSVAGNAKRVTLDWRNKDVAAYHGGYCLKIQTSGIATGSDYLEIRTTIAERISLSPGQSYVLAVFTRGDGTNNVNFSFGMTEYKSDNTVAATTTESPTPANESAWTLHTKTFTANANTVSGEIFLQVEANTIHYIDAFALLEGDPPADWYSGGYWEGDTYERVWTTLDIPPSVPGRAPSGLSDDASTSIADWGRQEETVTNDQVVDEATGQAFAIGWFNAHAVPSVQAELSLTITRPIDMPDFTGKIQILNLPDPPTAMFPSRIRYTLGDTIDCDVELGNQRPELVEMLRLLEKRR